MDQGDIADRLAYLQQYRTLLERLQRQLGIGVGPSSAPTDRHGDEADPPEWRAPTDVDDAIEPSAVLVPRGRLELTDPAKRSPPLSQPAINRELVLIVEGVLDTIGWMLRHPARPPPPARAAIPWVPIAAVTVSLSALVLAATSAARWAVTLWPLVAGSIGL